YPVKLVLCLCRVTVACRDITWAARFDLIRDLFSACLAECLDHIEYGISVSCSQVVDRYSRLLFQFLNCADMADRKVYYMDVVADTCSIRCVIVVAEYSKALKFSDRNLCDIRDQVVRDSLRILSDETALMCSDRVEVTEQDNIPFRICCVKICQDLLKHPLCPSVRIGAGSLRAFLCDRNERRISVNRS